MMQHHCSVYSQAALSLPADFSSSALKSALPVHGHPERLLGPWGFTLERENLQKSPSQAFCSDTALQLSPAGEDLQTEDVRAGAATGTAHSAWSGKSCAWGCLDQAPRCWPVGWIEAWCGEHQNTTVPASVYWGEGLHDKEICREIDTELENPRESSRISPLFFLAPQ